MSRSEIGTADNREMVSTRHGIARLKPALSEQAQRSLSHRDAEREMIARELHDNIGQYLTIVEIELGSIASHASLSPELRDRILGLRTLTADAQRDVGLLARDIRPASLDGLDLKSATERLIDEWSNRSALSFDLHIALGKQGLPLAVETTLFRVLQEAITNVAKHAKASRVGIILQVLPGEVRLVVEDDGSGFVQDGPESNPAYTPRLGLLGIHERLALVSGTLEIEQGSGRGTTLLVRVPL